ncbi:hypothetical protein AVEN_189137-1 [Araneus ventricosus]|uniref:Integrase catalytic domain-containing protein n=1 Tax=Araneus ventricosus TaxID=182803 RepID=A0A4Y2JUN0_ARAVE|nr:hypothetical protein AVEN_189137-1 [Araneus ventricosus]
MWNFQSQTNKLSQNRSKILSSSFVVAIPYTVSQDDKSWIADSRESQHMTFNSSIFESFKRFSVPEVINATVLKDNCTKFCRVFFLKAKGGVPNCIETFLEEAKTAGHTVKQMLCDLGTELINHSVKKILNYRGIDLCVAMVEIPEQNGGAERENPTIVEAARAMIHQKKLPKKLWAESCNTAAYVLNHTGLTPVDKTPYDLCHGKSENFNIKRLRIFGTKFDVHEPKQRRRKWDKKSVE